MSKMVTTFIGVVYPWHEDQMGHMNVQHYIGMFDGGTWNLFAETGLTAEWMKEIEIAPEDLLGEAYIDLLNRKSF